MVQWIRNFPFFLFWFKSHFSSAIFGLLDCSFRTASHQPERLLLQTQLQELQDNCKLLTEKAQIFLPQTSRWDDGYIASLFLNLQLTQNSTSYTIVGTNFQKTATPMLRPQGWLIWTLRLWSWNAADSESKYVWLPLAPLVAIHCPALSDPASQPLVKLWSAVTWQISTIC